MLQVETEAPDAERSGHATRALRSRPALPPALAVCVCGGALRARLGPSSGAATQSGLQTCHPRRRGKQFPARPHCPGLRTAVTGPADTCQHHRPPKHEEVHRARPRAVSPTRRVGPQSWARQHRAAGPTASRESRGAGAPGQVLGLLSHRASRAEPG